MKRAYEGHEEYEQLKNKRQLNSNEIAECRMELLKKDRAIRGFTIMVQEKNNEIARLSRHEETIREQLREIKMLRKELRKTRSEHDRFFLIAAQQKTQLDFNKSEMDRLMQNYCLVGGNDNRTATF